jgi:hypothetical protein
MRAGNSGSVSYSAPPWLDRSTQSPPPGSVPAPNPYQPYQPFDEECLSGAYGSPNYPLFNNDHTGIFAPFMGGQFKAGDARVLGESRLLLPFYQDNRRLFFGDFRGQYDDHGAVEGNFGLGYRTFVDAGWIFGFYGYYDVLRSQHSNTFSQGTVGVELLSLLWDFRVNGYFPETTLKGAGSVATVANGNLVLNNFGEKAYGGVDFETGYRVGRWGRNDQVELRWFVGGFFFDASGPGFREMIGPKTRLELRLYDLDLFGFQSRLEGGAEFTYDDVRDEQLFGFVRLRVPLSPGRKQQLTPLRRRMVDLPVRDMDIVTHRSHIGSERALYDGRRIDSFRPLQSTADWLNELHGAGRNSLVALDGSQGAFFLDQHESIYLQQGQMLLGGGSTITLQGEQTGRSTLFQLPGTRPTVFHAGRDPQGPVIFATDALPDLPDVINYEPCCWIDPIPPAIQLANNSVVQGLDLLGGETGIRGDNVNNILLKDLSIRHPGGDGVELIDSQNVTLQNITIRDGHETGVRVAGGRNIAIEQAVLERVSGSGLEITDSENVSVRNSIIRDLQPHRWGGWPWQPMPLPLTNYEGELTVSEAAALASEFPAGEAFDEIQHTGITEAIRLIYLPPQGIIANEVDGLVLTGNTIHADTGIVLFGAEGHLTFRDNRITYGDSEGGSFFSRGISLIDHRSGDVDISGNRLHAAGPGFGQVGIDIWTNSTGAHSLTIKGNILTGLSEAGISLLDASEPAGGTPWRAEISGNRLEYTQLGQQSGGWFWPFGGSSGSSQRQVNAIQAAAQGPGQIKLLNNTVTVNPRGGKYARLGSRISTWQGGELEVDLQQNQIPITVFDLVQYGDGEIRLLGNKRNSFDPVYQNYPNTTHPEF